MLPHAAKFPVPVYRGKGSWTFLSAARPRWFPVASSLVPKLRLGMQFPELCSEARPGPPAFFPAPLALSGAAREKPT